MRWLRLQVLKLKIWPPGGIHERQAHIPAQHPPPQARAWVSGAHEHKERPAGPETSPGEGAKASYSQQRLALLKFRQTQRIRRHADFQDVYANGTRASGRCFTIFSKPNGLPIGRLGIAATKRLGGAVVRNRAKRLIREVFRRNDIAPGFDIVVVPRRELLATSLTALEAEYRTSITRRVLKVR